MRQATRNMCLQALWLAVKKEHVQLLTVPTFWFAPGVIVTRYEVVEGSVNESTLYCDYTVNVLVMVADLWV